MSELTVSEVARRLGITDRRVRMLLADSELAARRLASGDWLADSDSLARYELRRKGSGRRLDRDTAWAILYELSGVEASHLLPRSTYARTRQRIPQMTAEDIAVAVSARTISHRFRAANAMKAQADLVRTGRAGSDIISSDLLPDTRRVAGYVPRGTTVSDFARAHFMVEDPKGPDVLYENTAPGGLHEPLSAVVAADLAISTDTRERSAGLHALQELKDTWLQSHIR